MAARGPGGDLVAAPGEVSALARGQLALPIPDLRPKPDPKPDPTPKPPLRRGQAGGGPAAVSDRDSVSCGAPGMGHAFIAASDAEQVLEEPRFSSSTPALEQTQCEGGCSSVLLSPLLCNTHPRAGGLRHFAACGHGFPTEIMAGQQEGGLGSSLALQNSC